MWAKERLDEIQHINKTFLKSVVFICEEYVSSIYRLTRLFLLYTSPDDEAEWIGTEFLFW